MPPLELDDDEVMPDEDELDVSPLLDELDVSPLDEDEEELDEDEAPGSSEHALTMRAAGRADRARISFFMKGDAT